MHYLKLIRYKNLLLLAFMQWVFGYLFLQYYLKIDVGLSNFLFGLGIFSTVCIAAAGYIINNIIDVETDKIVKPNDVIIGTYITEKQAYNIYFILNVIGVAIGFYISNSINKPNFTVLPIVMVSLLYVYSTSLKQSLLIGNFVVSILLAISLLVVPIYLLYPIITAENQAGVSQIFSIILDYSIFAFLINFIREIVKDMQDMEGDRKTGMNTLPIVLGISKTRYIVAGLGIFALTLLLWYLYKNVLEAQILLVYSLLFLVAPLLFFMIKLFQANQSNDFKQLSTILKLLIFFGIFSVVVMTMN